MNHSMGALRLEGMRENVALAPMTTLKVGGVARYFFIARSADDVMRALTAADEARVPVAILGGGSNTLVADAGFDGLVIKVGIMELSVADDVIRAGAGVPSVLVARKAAEAGLAGFEWLVTLPGVIGGAVYGNAGAFGSETKDHLVSVEIVAREADGWVRRERTKDDCHFDYRDSIFKHQKPRSVVASTTFRLPRGNRSVIDGNMKEFLAKRAGEQPLGSSSAGCMFKNPVLDGKRVSAGSLIDQSGLKGACVGKVCVSDKHGNFCLNTGGASSADITALAAKIKNAVRDRFGVVLEEEVQTLG